MKKSAQHRAIGWFFALLMLSSTAFAQTRPEIQPLYEEIFRFDSSLTISSSGYAECASEVSSIDLDNEIELTMTLQRSSNGRTWSNVKTWDTSDYGSASLDKGWYVSSGYSYRVKATAKVYDANGNFIESDTAISPVDEY